MGEVKERPRNKTIQIIQFHVTEVRWMGIVNLEGHWIWALASFQGRGYRLVAHRARCINSLRGLFMWPPQSISNQLEPLFINGETPHKVQNMHRSGKDRPSNPHWGVAVLWAGTSSPCGTSFSPPPWPLGINALSKGLWSGKILQRLLFTRSCMVNTEIKKRDTF